MVAGSVSVAPVDVSSKIAVNTSSLAEADHTVRPCVSTSTAMTGTSASAVPRASGDGPITAPLRSHGPGGRFRPGSLPRAGGGR